MLAVAAIPGLYALEALSFPVLLTLIFLGTLLDAPGNTARRAMVPELAAGAGMSIGRAAALHDGTYRAAQVLGAPVGGILIASIGTMNVLIIDAATFGISALLIGTLTMAGHATRSAEAEPVSGGYLRDIREGLGFIRQDALLPSILLMFVVANMLDNALFAVLLPTYAAQVIGDAFELGACVGALGAGALVGTLTYAAVGHRLPRRGLLVPALLLAGAPKFLVLATYPDVGILVTTMALAGLAAGPVNPLLGSVEFERIPAALRGRVLGALMSSVLAAVPLATLGAGLAVQVGGLRPILLAAAAAYLAIGLIPIFHRGWRELSARSGSAA